MLVLLGGGVAVALGGGGGDGDSDDVASLDGSDGTENDDTGGTGDSGSVDQSEMEDTLLEYVQCMRDHGIDMPDPEVDGGGIALGGPANGADAEEMDAVNEACQPILDEASRADPPCSDRTARAAPTAARTAATVRGPRRRPPR